MDKLHHVISILSYCGQINPKPDMIILQEFDIRSKETVEFQRKMGELGYRMESEYPTKRPSMTVFFIAQEVGCDRIDKIHDRNLRAYAVKTKTDNYIIYGTHIPPKYDENFWDEIDRFAQARMHRKLIMIGDFNTINDKNHMRLKQLFIKTKAKDVWAHKGNRNPISISGDYAIISESIDIEQVKIAKDEITLKDDTDHPVVILTLP